MKEFKAEAKTDEVRILEYEKENNMLLQRTEE